MKLTVLGGGGVRSPLLARSIVQQAGKLGIREVVFMDNNAEKLRIYGGIARNIAAMQDPSIRFSLMSDITSAVSGAHFIITTIRVGAEQGRVYDERIALDLGVLGQETTGAGGFSMAMRSIPVLTDYMQVIRQHADPSVKVFNFTNPSGLVTQALHHAGHTNVYGICDGPSEFIKELERLLHADPGEVQTECFGLNHLSWFRNVRFGGRDVTCELIHNKDLYRLTEMRFFDPDLVAQLGVLLNGYLYYYYHREQALANILKSGKTRGETILEINGRMEKELSSLDIDNDFETAAQIYLKFYDMRELSYMSIESGGTKTDKKPLDCDTFFHGKDDGGYAGVALKLIESFTTGAENEMVLMVPNHGSIDGLRDDDTIEVTCRISRDGVTPVRIGAVEPVIMNLIHQVKLFERLSVSAISERSISKGRLALSVHPLVGSYSLAKELLAKYLEAHREYVGTWSK